MGGVINGYSHRNAKDRTDVKPRAVPELPKLAGWLELDSAEARRLQVWGQRIIDDIKQWRHREARRREGVRP
ncbi:hypothetical protein MNQ96_12715 [Sphingopyxis granuli]|uniref:hypothetical protein n=1 Tax=Sphingopyxis granuli TaxID=267128 RepID=UPI001F53C663|nr:hypothetical protein [Sphingopyxis granuli]UNK78428.1 hypothetical protein MNQ96_12715 [Sphingopyxis granuli]